MGVSRRAEQRSCVASRSRVPSALLLQHIITFTYYFGSLPREHSGHVSKTFRSQAQLRAQFTRAMSVNSGTNSDLQVLLFLVKTTSIKIGRCLVSSNPPCDNYLILFYCLFFSSFSYSLGEMREEREKKTTT